MYRIAPPTLSLSLSLSYSLTLSISLSPTVHYGQCKNVEVQKIYKKGDGLPRFQVFQ